MGLATLGGDATPRGAPRGVNIMLACLLLLSAPHCSSGGMARYRSQSTHRNLAEQDEGTSGSGSGSLVE
eukprot:4692790-Prymnesium_polylepis.1